jgi:hypothetical protein
MATRHRRASIKSSGGRAVRFITLEVNFFALFGQREIAQIAKRSANSVAIATTDNGRRRSAFRVPVDDDAQSVTMDANELKSGGKAHFLT